MKICLIGSARFEKEFKEAARELTLRGCTVYSLSVYPSDMESQLWYTNSEKVVLDLVHLNKILNSDFVVLVGDGYIGESTAREILWAGIHDKQVIPVYKNTYPEGTVGWDRIKSNYGAFRDDKLEEKAYLVLERTPQEKEKIIVRVGVDTAFANCVTCLTADECRATGCCVNK